MNVTVFGTTGGVGSQAVDQPRSRGHAMTAYVRELVDRQGASNTDSSRAPSHLANQTRLVWQYRHAPAGSGLLIATIETGPQ